MYYGNRSMRSAPWAVALVAVLAVAGLAGNGRAAAQRYSALDPGDKIRSIESTDMNGQKRSLASYKGKIVLLEFWATWCPPCRASIPNVVRVYKEFHGRGFEVLGVSEDSTKAAVTAFVKTADMTWPQVYDAAQKTKLGRTFEVKGIPSTYLIDGTTGRIIAKDLGGDALRDAVQKALANRNSKR